jgi:hypothetical protein
MASTPMNNHPSSMLPPTRKSISKQPIFHESGGFFTSSPKKDEKEHFRNISENRKQLNEVRRNLDVSFQYAEHS